MAAGKTLRVNQTKDRSTYFKFYAEVSGDIDLLADGPSGLDETPCAEIHVFGEGDLQVEKMNGDTETIKGIPAGYALPISVKRVLASETTAENILVLW
jgi:hypothetical protein